MRKFTEYVLLRELDEKKSPDDDKSGKGSSSVSTSMKLGSNNEFQPFVVTDDPRNQKYPSHENLAPIVRAFKDASKIKVYDSLGKDGKSKPHTLPQKKLYLVGGPVRDHLSKQTPKDIDLATDATSDEIRMVLKDAGFKEVGDKDKSTGSARWFKVKGRDKTGKDFVFMVHVNGEEFDLATFRKDHASSDGRHPDQMDFGSHAEDASRRDLTINSMYLTLTNDNGPNTDITDFHGGVHDLAQNNVKFVGNAKDRLGEDNLRALRYARFAAKFGKGKVDPEIAAHIKEMGPEIQKSVSPERIREEFLKGLKYEDVDPATYIKIYKDMGLLDVVFPGIKMKLNKPEDYPTDRDPALLIAHMFKGNDPHYIQQVLKAGKWNNQEQGRVGFLHDILNLSPATDPDTLEKHLHSYKQSGVMDKAVEGWFSKNRKDAPQLIKAFLAHAHSPRISVVKKNDETGFPDIDPGFLDLFDQMSGKPLPGKEQEVGKRKKNKEHQNFQRVLKHATKEHEDQKATSKKD